MITLENKILHDFWSDAALRDSVHEYLVEFMKQEAIRELFDNVDSDYDAYQIARAKLVIDKAFDKLDDMFEVKSKPTGTTSPR